MAKANDFDICDEKNIIVKVPDQKFGRLIKLNQPEWIYACAGIIGAILSGLVSPSFAYVISSIEGLYYSLDYHYMRVQIIRYGIVFVGIALASPVVYCIQHLFLGIMGENLIKRLRELLLTAILRNEISWFEEEDNNSNQLASRLAADTMNVKTAVGDSISLVVQNSTTILAACVVAICIEWKLALVTISTLPVILTAGIYNSCFREGFSGDDAEAHARATMLAGEAVCNIRTVKAFNAQERTMERFTQELEGPMKSGLRKGVMGGLSMGFSQLGLFAAYAAGLWYVGVTLREDRATLSDALKVYNILTVATFVVADAVASSPKMVRTESLNFVFNLLDRRSSIDPDENNELHPNEIRGDIQFKCVKFYYPSRPNVTIFKSLNLTVSSGHSLALVGASGSGKSSVIALIERFYDPVSGIVTIDGKNLKNYHLKSLRKHIALVQQEPALFATTIYENILYGKEGASDSEIIQAAKAANAHTFISALPDGYQTEVGERGASLSGGQKQRVAIARAMLKNPAILLLDEATSALDAESERVVQQALDKLMEKRTTVMVAHRLSTIRSADTIAVVHNGSIVEKGTHDDLLHRPDGAYARLVNLQHSNWT